MVIATVPLMLCIMLVDTHDEIVVGLSIISKLASNVGWFVMWVQCVEVNGKAIFVYNLNHDLDISNFTSIGII